jgi:hypothetical protein
MKFKIEGEISLPQDCKESVSNRNSILVLQRGKKTFKLKFGIEVYDKETDKTYFLSSEQLTQEGFQIDKMTDCSWNKPRKPTKKK